MGNVFGAATSELCPECGSAFLVRKPNGGLECPGCGYEEATDE